MIRQINPFNYKSLLVVAICLIASTGVFAISEKNQLLVTQNLAKKLQSDLANDSVTVKLNNLKENVISKNELGLTGDAVCVLASNKQELPIAFEVKVSTINESVIDVKYDFIEAVSEFAPSQNEEILMKELMKKISRDYKTQNIVIAIDGFENVGNAAGGNKFLGVGEVRIGDMVWNKIKFDVVLDSQNQNAQKVVYKLEK